MVSTTCKLISLKALLKDMRFDQNTPIEIKCDNRAAIYISSKPIFHEKMKHIEVDCHFVREKVQVKIIFTPHISTEDQLTDIFTKAIENDRLKSSLIKLSIISINAST